MKLNKFLAIASIAVSGFLYSCSCEDVNLGELEQTGEFNAYMPALGNGGNLVMAFNNKVIPIWYNTYGNYATTRVPVRETGSSGTRGKGASYDCVEYYTTTDKDVMSFSTESSPAIVFIKQTKNVNPEGFTPIAAKDQVEDVIEYGIGFNNKFPVTVTRGMMNYDSYMPYRYFALSKNPDALLYKKNDVVQEYLPTVTLNGVVHQNVYHLYITTPQYTEDEKYLNTYYQLEYIKGIYVKEGAGLIQAYTSNGQKIDFRVE